MAYLAWGCCWFCLDKFEVWAFNFKHLILKQLQPELPSRYFYVTGGPSLFGIVLCSKERKRNEMILISFLKAIFSGFKPSTGCYNPAQIFLSLAVSPCKTRVYRSECWQIFHDWSSVGFPPMTSFSFVLTRGGSGPWFMQSCFVKHSPDATLYLIN